MRSKKALLNTCSGIMYEVVQIICGLILPRLILSRFGSSYNGITASVTQFLSAVSLLRAGINNVTRASLYKPLAEQDTEQISSIVRTAESFLRKIAGIFCVATVAFACIYPVWVKEDFSWLFTFTLILILSISTFMQYFFGLTYKMLLNAAQMQSVTYIIQIICTILNTIIAAILIYAGASIHVVKLGSAIVFAMSPLFTNLYAKKKYHLNPKAPVNNDLLKQRWDAFWQEIANFVHNNTDLIVLTIFTNLREVSVYTVYNYVIKGIKQVLEICVTSFGSAFGDMLSRNETELVKENLKIYELIVFSLVSVIYTTAGIMIVPYALLYTNGVQDVNYARPVFAALVVIAGAVGSFRIPYLSITIAAGHFKQTRRGAFIEAALNIIISLMLVVKWGLIGVAIGTLVATIFRSVQYALYLAKNVVPRSVTYFVKHVIICGISSIIIIVVSNMLILPYLEFTVVSWIITAIAVTLCAIIITLIFDILFYRQDLLRFLTKVMKVVRKKK